MSNRNLSGVRRYEYERARAQLLNFTLFVLMSTIIGAIVWYLRDMQ